MKKMLISLIFLITLLIFTNFENSDLFGYGCMSDCGEGSFGCPRAGLCTAFCDGYNTIDCICTATECKAVCEYKIWTEWFFGMGYYRPVLNYWFCDFGDHRGTGRPKVPLA